MVLSLQDEVCFGAGRPQGVVVRLKHDRWHIYPDLGRVCLFAGLSPQSRRYLATRLVYCQLDTWSSPIRSRHLMGLNASRWLGLRLSTSMRVELATVAGLLLLTGSIEPALVGCGC